MINEWKEVMRKSMMKMKAETIKEKKTTMIIRRKVKENTTDNSE